MSKEREVSKKIISTDDTCNWNFIVEDIGDYDHVYVNGVRYVEFQPKKEFIDLDKADKHLEICDKSEEYRDGYSDGIVFAERHHAIRGQYE